MVDFTPLDFIPVYPPQDSPDIQLDLTKRKEFNEYKGSYNDQLRPEGFFNHQGIIMRFFREYSRLMLIHEAGTGKTCTFVLPAQYFFEFSDLYKRAYVLERNDATANDFKQQILNVCAKGKYANSREMEKWFEVTTYQKFIENELGLKQYKQDLANLDLEEVLGREDIQRRFNGCMFLIDEAHNLRNSDHTNATSGTDEEVAQETGEGGDDVTIFMLRVAILKKLFRDLTLSKVVVSTATPMINDTSEFRTLANLILDEDLPEDIDESTSVEDLEPYLRGRVSYVRALDTGINAIYQGKSRADISEEIIESHLNVVPLKTHGYQRAALEHYSQDASNFRNAQITASSFVFPTKSVELSIRVDHEAVDIANMKFVDKAIFTSGGKQYTFAQYVSDFGRLKRLSTKFAFIIKNELRYAYSQGRLSDEDVRRLRNQGVRFDEWEDYELRDDIEVGNSFVYTSNLNAMGATMLGLIMTQYGFHIFSATGKNLVAPDGSVNMNKALRVAIFSGTFGGVAKTALQVFAAKDNYNGDYLQCVVGSRVVRDGINLPNSTRFYMAVPEWHYSGMYQAMSRIIRATSHIYLRELKAERLRAAGIEPTEENVRINVGIYLLCAFAGGLSVDDQLYGRNEEKDKEIRQVMRKLKIISFDCMLNYDRNVQRFDQDYSRECDYTTCDYICYQGGREDPVPGGMANGQGPTPEEYNLDTYNILYADEMIDRARDFILQSIKFSGSTTFDKIIDAYYRQIQEEGREEFQKKDIQRYVFEAVERQVAGKKPFNDTYGYKTYMQTDGVNIFIQREIPKRNVEGYGAVGFYNLQLVGYERKNLAELSLHIATPTNEVAERIMKMDPSQAIEALFELSSRIEFLKVMEYIISQYYHHNRKTKATRYLIEDYYRIYILEFTEPTEALSLVAERSQVSRITDEEIFHDLPFDDDPSKKVVVHLLKSSQTGATSVIFYKPSQSAGVLRVLPSNNDEFRDPHLAEKKLYSELFRCYYDEFRANIHQGDTYLIVQGEVDKIARRTDLGPRDSRKDIRGGDCKSFQLDKMIPYLSSVGSPRDFDKTTRISQWEEYIKSKSPSKPQLCNFLSRRLREMGKVVEHPTIYPS